MGEETKITVTLNKTGQSMTRNISTKSVLITKVEGPKEMKLNEKGTFKVTRYNTKKPPQKVKDQIKWAIKVGDEKIKELKNKKGESIEFTPNDKNMEGKEIILMPFLKKYTERISVKTKILISLIDVTTSSGKFLFSLKPNKKHKSQKITAKKLYKKGLQWFCPNADNYIELIKTNEQLKEFKELKHFSWDEIIKFSEQERWNISYRTGGSGDWKASSRGADGYLLVSIDGFPYWADAIGQIPFTIDVFTDYLEDGYSKSESTKKTLSTGQKFGDGEIFGGKSDFSNGYDNHMILRTCLWAKDRYKVKFSKGLISDSYEVSKTTYSPKKLSKFLSKVQTSKYL